MKNNGDMMKDKDSWRHDEENDNWRRNVIRITGDVMKDNNNWRHDERQGKLET
jgi:hypothetical protein